MSEMHFLALSSAMKTKNNSNGLNKAVGTPPAERGGHRLAIGTKTIPSAQKSAGRQKTLPTGKQLLMRGSFDFSPWVV